jgi:low affinity Fe/Cu permease
MPVITHRPGSGLHHATDEEFSMLGKAASSTLTKLGSFSANPFAFLTVIAYGGFWFIFQRDTFDWHGVATLATWTMTLFIQRSEHRDTQAIHAKLDDLLRSHADAKSELATIDEKEPEEIEKYREAHNDEAAG